MSTIAFYHEVVAEETPRCSLCGQHSADAWWVADAGNLFICHWCATTNSLPKILADCVAQQLNPERDDLWTEIGKALASFEGAFHRALVIALCKQMKAARGRS